MQTIKRELPMQHRAASVQAESYNDDAHTIDVVWSSGASVERGGFWTEPYIEELSMEPSAVRLGRLNGGAAFLNSHDAHSLNSVIGVVVDGSARIENGRGVATIRLSGREDLAPIIGDIRAGIIRNISVGYMIHAMNDVTPKDAKKGSLRVLRAVDWEPFEISAVPVPADAGAQIRSQDERKYPVTIRTNEGLHEMDDQQPNGAAAEAAVDGKEGIRMNTKDTPEAPKPAAQPAIDAGEIRRIERERIAEIGRVARSLKLPATFMNDLMARDVELDEARTLMINEHARLAESTEISTIRVSGGATDGEKFRDGATAWLLRRSGNASKALEDIKASGGNTDPGEFRGLSLVDLCRHSLSLSGLTHTGLNKYDVVRRAMTLRAGTITQSTGDFPILLENTMHKMLEAGYAVAPDTWRSFCDVGSVSDFRAHNRYRTGSFGALDLVAESALYKDKGIPDGEKESIAALKRGNMINVSLEMIVNDDMSAFTRLPSMLGRAAGLSIEMAVYALLAENAGLGPVMSDGNTLFHASHNNIGTGSTLSVLGIEADRIVMASQTDVSGNEILDLRPNILVVPIGLGGTARQINNDEKDPDVTDKNRSNIVRGTFSTIIDTPRMSGTRRYLFADPAIAPTLEVAFLDGEQQPQLESQEGWRQDGIEWKIRHIWAADATGYRGSVTNAGA